MMSKQQQAVIVFLKLSDEEFGSSEEREHVFGLEDRIEALLQEDPGAECDGHEFGDGWAKLYLYGEDCGRLLERVMPALREFRPRAGSYVVQRQGSPGSPEISVTL